MVYTCLVFVGSLCHPHATHVPFCFWYVILEVDTLHLYAYWSSAAIIVPDKFGQLRDRFWHPRSLSDSINCGSSGARKLVAPCRRQAPMDVWM